MDTFIGNTTNSIVVVKGSGYLNNPLGNDMKNAQSILKRLDSRNKEEIIDLTKSLYNDIVKTNFSNGWFLRNSTKVIIDWDEIIEKKSFANFSKVVRGYMMTNILLDWHKKLISELKKLVETKQIYIFNENSMLNIWVTVDNASTDLILRYSEIYMNLLEDNLDSICDFMVFNPSEICDYIFPKENTILINCEG